MDLYNYLMSTGDYETGCEICPFHKNCYGADEDDVCPKTKKDLEEYIADFNLLKKLLLQEEKTISSEVEFENDDGTIEKITVENSLADVMPILDDENEISLLFHGWEIILKSDRTWDWEATDGG